MSRNKKIAKKYSKEKNTKVKFNQDELKGSKECPSGNKDNDPRWYATDPNLVSDFAKLSFSNAVGYLNDIRPTTGTDPSINYSGGTKGYYVTPGLMTLELVPTIGVAFSNNTAVNKGAMDLITQIRSRLGSFTKIYDAPDVMKYILAVDSAQTFYYFMCRLYGLMNLYYVDNQYYPETLIKANNVNFQSITAQHANEFKGYIDKYANYVSKFPIPATLSLLARHAWLYQNLYTDSDALKPQLYMFVPGQFLKYTETSGSNICLTYEDFGPSYHAEWDLNSLMTFGNNLLNAIQTSQDLQYIAGDIRKAFGDEMMVPIYQIDQNYVVPQTHSFEILSQIENATAVGKNATQWIAENYDSVDPNVATGLMYGGTYGSITLGSNRITVVDSTPVYAGEKILNFHKTDAPTGDDVMVATRLTAVSRTTREVDGSYLGILSCGSEFVTKFRVYRQYLNSSGAAVVGQVSYSTNFKESNYDNLCSWIVCWSAFDWAPQLDLLNTDPSDPTLFVKHGSLIDVANYTILPSSKLEQIHEVALMSEFGITQATDNKANFSTEKYSTRK